MKLKIDERSYESSDYEEWEVFLKLIEVMEPDYLLGILEHYDLWNWM